MNTSTPYPWFYPGLIGDQPAPIYAGKVPILRPLIMPLLGREITPAEADANARLAVQSPAMLEALKVCAVALWQDAIQMGVPEVERNTLRMVNAIIARIEGPSVLRASYVCPDCHSAAVVVRALASVRVTPCELDQVTGFEWTDESPACCQSCTFEGPLSAFHARG